MQQTQWAPPTAGIAGCGGAGVVMAIASVSPETDPPGRVMTGIGGLGLILFASASWRARPKLAITAGGLVIRGWFRTQVFQPADIKIIRITEFRRLARKMRLLEVETVSGGPTGFSGGAPGPEPLTVLAAPTKPAFAGPRPD